MLKLIKMPVVDNEVHIVELLHKDVFNVNSGVLPPLGTLLDKSTIDYSEMSDKIYKLTACINESMNLPGQLSLVLKKSPYLLVDDALLIEELNKYKIEGIPLRYVVDKRI